MHDAEVGEAMACREGLALTSDLGLHSFQSCEGLCQRDEELHGQGSVGMDQ